MIMMLMLWEGITTAAGRGDTNCMPTAGVYWIYDLRCVLIHQLLYWSRPQCFFVLSLHPSTTSSITITRAPPEETFGVSGLGESESQPQPCIVRDHGAPLLI